MKKYFPILAFILIFTGLLGGQFVFDFLSAGPTTKEKSINAHYQSMYSKLQVKSVANKNYDLPKLKGSNRHFKFLGLMVYSLLGGVSFNGEFEK